MPFAPTSILTYTFISLLVATTLVRIWLARRHIVHVQANRNQVPVAFKDNIALDAHQKAADYSTDKTKLIITETVVQALLLAILTLGGGLQWIDDIWRNVLPTQEIIRGALVICSAMLVSSVIDLPFEYYKTFVVF
jgi:STE24 endopeptidase